MKYRDIVSSEIINLKQLAPYIKMGNESDEFVLVEFNKADEKVIIEAYLNGLRERYKERFFEMENMFDCDDGFLYLFSKDGLQKTEKKVQMNFEEYYIRMMKKREKDIEYAEKKLARYDKNTCKDFISISGFRYGEFIDKTNGVCISYRLKKCKKENRPIVIYFHGGGCLGRSNIKPLGEFFLYNIAKHFLKKECTILVPQAPKGTTIGLDRNERYAKTVHLLVDQVCRRVKADRKRIYIVGTSFGGGCVWQYSFMYPETVAAAVPVMGSFAELYVDKDIDFGEMTNVPFWVAHAADDKVVDVKYDDLCVDKIRAAGGEAKYTRTATYGHKLADKFYRNEAWAEWLFGKSKQQ